jgi:hypothetical protein
METTNIKDLLKNWDQYDELETEKIIREYTNNYNNHFAIKAVIGYFKNAEKGLELDIQNFRIKDETTGKSSVLSLNYDRLGDVEFLINNKEYDDEYFFSAISKILSKNQLGLIIEDLEKKVKTPQQAENIKPDEVKKELYNHIFKGNAFEVFEKYHTTKSLAENSKTDLNLLFQLFENDNLFVETVELKHYIKWLNKKYSYSLTELKKVNINSNPNIQRANDYNEHKKTTLKQP